MANVTTRAQAYSSALDASWEIDLFGRQRQKREGRVRGPGAGDGELSGAQVSLAAEVADAYVTLRAAEDQLAVAERSVAARRRRCRSPVARAGGPGECARYAAGPQHAGAGPRGHSSIQETIGQTRNQLALLAGRTPGALDALVKKARRDSRTTVAAGPGIPADTLRQRPDVRAAERRWMRRSARTKSAERQRLPSLILSGLLAWTPLTAGRVFSPQTAAASVLGGLTAPIFDAGRNHGQTSSIQTELEKQALIAYESTVLAALSEVENALIAVRRTAERLAILARRGQLPRARRKSSRQQRYEAGQADPAHGARSPAHFAQPGSGAGQHAGQRNQRAHPTLQSPRRRLVAAAEPIISHP